MSQVDKAPAGPSPPKGKQLKVVAVLPEGGDAAKDPAYVCCVENALGLRDFCSKRGWELVVTADKEGKDSELDRALADADIVITTPFHPAYMDKQRIQSAPELKLILTAGVGSDHVDLHAAADKGITVAECTGSNVTSVAEDEVMRMLIMFRNFIPAHEGDWNVPAVAKTSQDIEGKTIGTHGAGRIGKEVMKRLQGWGVKRVYYARHPKPDMDELGVERVEDEDKFLSMCDLVTINVPLTDSTRGMFNAELIGKMKKGAYLVNNARGAIVDKEAVVEALRSGHLGGYGGDVWDEQPASKDHPWRTMPHNAMTAHTSGTTLDAQVRYQEGTLSMLEAYEQGKAFPEDNYIVTEGEIASQYV